MTDVVRSLPGVVQQLYRLLLHMMLMTPQQGARSTIFCAVDRGACTDSDASMGKNTCSQVLSVDGCRGCQGKHYPAGYVDSNLRKGTPHPSAHDASICNWLWTFSSREVALDPSLDLPAAAAN